MPSNNRLTVGILGGMGPAATLDLFGKLIRATPAQREAEHLNIQIDCNPVPGIDEDALCRRAARLEKWGVDVIAIPCNAAHVYYAAIQQAVQIPVANMIREAVVAVAGLALSCPTVGILAAREVLQFGLYQVELAGAGLACVIPLASETTVLSDVIQAVKENAVADTTQAAAKSVGRSLIDRGANAIILGCTELPLVISQADFDVPVIDATQALARAVVLFAAGQVRP